MVEGGHFVGILLIGGGGGDGDGWVSWWFLGACVRFEGRGGGEVVFWSAARGGEVESSRACERKSHDGLTSDESVSDRVRNNSHTSRTLVSISSRSTHTTPTFEQTHLHKSLRSIPAPPYPLLISLPQTNKHNTSRDPAPIQHLYTFPPSSPSLKPLHICPRASSRSACHATKTNSHAA